MYIRETVMIDVLPLDFLVRFFHNNLLCLLRLVEYLGLLCTPMEGHQLRISTEQIHHPHLSSSSVLCKKNVSAELVTLELEWQAQHKR